MLPRGRSEWRAVAVIQMSDRELSRLRVMVDLWTVGSRWTQLRG